MKLRFWGVRGSYPVPGSDTVGIGGNTPCIEVGVSEDKFVVIDAGTGIHRLGRHISETQPSREVEVHILLSHFHWDHIQGIPFFDPIYWKSAHIKIYSNLLSNQTAELINRQMRNPYFPVPFENVAADIEFLELSDDRLIIDGCEISTFPLTHPGGCSGFRLERDSTSIVFASDHEHGIPVTDSGIRDQARNASAIIMDTHFTPEEIEFTRGWGHGTWEEATRLAEESTPDRLFLFHHNPKHTDEKLYQIEKEAQRNYENTFLSREGDLHEL